MPDILDALQKGMKRIKEADLSPKKPIYYANSEAEARLFKSIFGEASYDVVVLKPIKAKEVQDARFTL